MAEPQPPIKEGTDATTDNPPATAPPASAEDRKTAAALSTLDDAPQHSSTTSKNIDQDALAQAISRLEFSTTGAKGVEISDKEKAWNERRRNARESKGEERVKVLGEDVALLVGELEVSKGRAMELLRENGGDVGGAMRVWVGVGV